MRRRRKTSSLRHIALLVALLLALGTAASGQEDFEEPDPSSAGEAQPDAFGGDVDDDLFLGEAAAPDPPPEAPAQEPDPALVERPGAEILEPQRRSEGIEEIVIEGRASGDDLLQQEAVSGAVFSAEDLRTLRIQNIEDVADFTPNLEINTAFAASNPTIFIRGIGLKDYNANAAGAVSVYVDGININSPAIQLAQLFDIEQIDVRRGPQGGVNGRNATAGAIMIRSKLPDGELGAEGSISYGNYNSLNVEGAINVPLVPDLLSSRFAFTVNMRDGITENACADWDPRKRPEFQDAPGRGNLTNSFLVTPETLRAEYEKDLAAGILPNAARYTIQSTRLRSRGNVLPDAKALFLDGACILKDPGAIVISDPELAAGTFVANNVPQLSDFQGLKHHTNNVDDWAARGVFRLTPPAEMEWLLNLHGMINRSDSRHLQMLGADARKGGVDPNAFIEPGFFDRLEDDVFSEASIARLIGSEKLARASGLIPNGPFPGLRATNPYKGYYNQDGDEDLEAWGTSLRGSWDIPIATVTWLSGFETYKRRTEDEGDANPISSFPAIWRDQGWQLSQELRIEGQSSNEGPGAYNWAAGFYYLREQITVRNKFPDTRQFVLIQDFDQDLDSLAPYLAGRYWITDSISIEGGVRYSYERKQFVLKSSALGTSSGENPEEIPEQRIERTWDSPLGEVTLHYEPEFDWLDRIFSDRFAAYLKYGRAMKGGHFNANILLPNNVLGQSGGQTIQPVDAEFIHALELGVHTDWWDGQVRLNAAVFRYWYDDFQVFDVANEQGQLPFQKLLNANAHVWGAETDLRIQHASGLRIDASFAWLNSQFENFEVRKSVLNQRNDPSVGRFDYDGNPLIAAPRFSASGIAEWEIPLGRYGFLIPHYNISYRSKIYFDPQKADPISQPGYTLHGARIAWRDETGRLELAGWIDNLTNEEYKVDAFDVTREFNTILEVYGDPRTYGLTLYVAF